MPTRWNSATSPNPRPAPARQPAAPSVTDSAATISASRQRPQPSADMTPNSCTRSSVLISTVFITPAATITSTMVRKM